MRKVCCWVHKLGTYYEVCGQMWFLLDSWWNEDPFLSLTLGGYKIAWIIEKLSPVIQSLNQSLRTCNCPKYL